MGEASSNGSLLVAPKEYMGTGSISSRNRRTNFACVHLHDSSATSRNGYSLAHYKFLERATAD